MQAPLDNSHNAFRKWGVVTVVFVYLLIAIGGIVRSTGSGMGCPDWPKCFGSWVPPTDVSQLPADYRETYAQKRKDKNEKLAGYLSKIGLADLGKRISADPDMYVEAEFNAVKTWIEYLNRLFGVLVGLLIVGTAVLSLRFWNRNRAVTVASLLSLVLVGLQGWLGSVVVSTNLLPGTITVHMLLAIAIVFALIYAVQRASQQKVSAPRFANKTRLNGVVWVAIGLSFVQIVLGTQVREAIDWVADEMRQITRSEWIDQLGWEFYVHRSFSLLVLGVNAYLLYLLRDSADNGLRRWAGVLLGVTLVEILSGVGMAYFAVPPFLQPVHLLLATVAVGVQYVIYLRLNPSRRTVHLKNQTTRSVAN
ncbi:MAG: COX15/CtaA family protein [Cytophagales bacterium]|jgi:cytochrome c oxidase assembly protein subunit 15|nr:COX15/CtaA family protein [Cytophagales bacterium]